MALLYTYISVTFKYILLIRTSMGTITISVDDEIEMQFREVVKEEIGETKGSIGSAVTEALNLWITQKQQTEISQRQLALISKGFRLGKYKFDREELHERRN